MDYKSYIKEVVGFLLYSQLIWPIHRKLVRRLITPRCKKCIASANLRPLGSDGLCTDCRNPQLENAGFYKTSDEFINRELSEYLKSFCGKGKGRWDAVLLFSGGKDSVYMADRIRQEYPQLRIVLLTVDNSFMSPIAMGNIAQLVTSMGIESEIYSPPPALYEKMYRYAFLHLNEKGCSGTVDQFDGDFFHDVARNWAAKRKIPLVLSGCSKTQVIRVFGIHHFEFPRSFESQERQEVAGIKLKDIFSDDEMRFWWNGAFWPAEDRPHVVFPFYAWDLEEQAIIKSVTEKGLIPKGASSPLLTNNQLVPLMAMVDMTKFGYSSFEPEFTQMVREKKADGALWRNIFELSEYAAKTGQFVSKSVDQVLSRLNLTRKDLGLKT